MQELKYMGPRPSITQNGIFFKDGKEDKYIYLKTASEILLSIDDKYKNKQDIELTKINHHDLNDSDIIQIIKEHETNLEEHIQIEKQKYELHLEDKIEEIKNNKTLTNEEKKTWINNLNIMKEYMIQREINKLFYIHLIKAIKRTIKENKIYEIDIDFSLEHWHVLSTISGNLEYGINSISTSIKMDIDKNKEFFIKLIINN